MTTRAHFERKQASLSGEFGQGYAQRHFNLTLDQLEQMVGRYTRGARKGQLRGLLVWHVVTRGGWVSELGGGGFVTTPGLRYGHAIIDGFSGKHFHGIPQDWSTAEMIRGTRASQRAQQAATEREQGVTLDMGEASTWLCSMQAAGVDGATACALIIRNERGYA